MVVEVMDMAEYVSYIRGTKDQGIAGMGLEAQQDEITHFLNNGGNVLDVLVDIESDPATEEV